MKRTLIKTMVLLLMLPLIYFGCKKSEVTDDQYATSKDNTSGKTGIVYSGTPLNATLLELGDVTNFSYGSVVIGNDASKLYVTFTLTGNWMIYEDPLSVNRGADLFVGTEAELLAVYPGTAIFPNSVGVFYFWKFPYQYEAIGLNEQSHTFEIDRSLINDSYPYVVLGVKIKDIVTNEVKFVSAKSNLKCMGWYLRYPMQVSQTGTAYAKSETTSTCFLNLPPPGAQSNNWGWTNYVAAPASGIVTIHWPIYAGAAQCDIANGTLAGYVDGTYDGAHVELTYNMLPGFYMTSSSAWIGSDYLPMKKGKYVTSPGQFPYLHSNLANLSTDHYGPIAITGNIYISAHVDATW